MDVPDVAVGNVIYLPVNKDGAYLYLGDCHAAQGDGELCGVAIEHPTVTEIQVDLIKWEPKGRKENSSWLLVVDDPWKMLFAEPIEI